MSEMIKISKIEKPVELMMRVEIDNDLVKRYAAEMKEGALFPPVSITRVDDDLFLTDGWHRIGARERQGETTIAAVITDGTFEDAQDAAIASVRANSYGGKKHKDKEKEKAVKMALSMPRHQELNDQMVANLVGVSDTYVRNLRKSVQNHSKLNSDNQPAKPAPQKKRGKDGKRYPTTKRKRNKGASASPPKSKPTLTVVKNNPPGTSPFGGLTKEQTLHAKGHDDRHVFTMPIEEEIARNNKIAARAFSGAARDFGLAAVSFLKNVEEKGSFEIYGKKNDKRPFTTQQYFDTLKIMTDNDRQLWQGKLASNLEAIAAAWEIISPFVDVVPHKIKMEESK